MFRRLLGLLVLAAAFLLASSLGGLVHSVVRELPPASRHKLYWLVGASVACFVVVALLRARRLRAARHSNPAPLDAP
ncbi:MAG: hypothetical protein FJ164_14460 [Gammaproteobacteria bacterium]|nr:hypothetical protein [Gammaproteobacteria bacterium]